MRTIQFREAIAEAMKYVDYGEYELERLQAERNAEKKREMAGTAN